MEKDLKPSKEQLEPVAPPWVSEPLGPPDKPLTAGEPEREVDMESLLPKVMSRPGLTTNQPNPGPQIPARSIARLRAARKRFWDRFRSRHWGAIRDELEQQDKEAAELEATMEKYTSKVPNMHIQPEQKRQTNPKLWLRIKFDAQKHEPFFVEANCTKFTQDQGDLRLELTVNLENMQRLVGNYGKSQMVGVHTLIKQLSVSDIEILRSGKGKRIWLLKNPGRRKICFEVQNISTEMLPSRLFRVNLRCSKV